MKGSTWLCRTTALAAVFLLAAPLAASARAASGSSDLKGRLVIVAKGCGRRAGNARATFALAADGSWSVGILNGGLSGTSTPLDTSGRKLGLTFDEVSSGALKGIVLEDVVGLICHHPAQLGEPMQDAFVLAFNKQFTRVKMTVRYHFTGAPGQRPSVVREVIVMRGRWLGAQRAGGARSRIHRHLPQPGRTPAVVSSRNPR